MNAARLTAHDHPADVLGHRAEYGPRNDQYVTTQAPETLLGFDVRVILPTLILSGEYVHVKEEDAARGENTGGLRTACAVGSVSGIRPVLSWKSAAAAPTPRSDGPCAVPPPSAP